LVSITLDGSEAEFSGSVEDEYFQQLQLHASGLGAIAAFVRRNVRMNAIIADIGANIGLTAVLFARLVPDGHVYAFEPSPSTADYLQRNVEANGLRNVTVIKAALGATNGMVRFAHAERFTAGSGVRAGGGTEVPVITLDDYAAKHGVRFDFLKIDAEGYEPWVLSGLAAQLRLGLPIWMEFNCLCLTATGANALAFACSLPQACEIQRVEPDRSFTSMVDGNQFLYENMVQRGCVDDLIMRLRPDCKLPSLATLIGHEPWRSAPPEEREARAKLDAIYRSTSWRITAPLRAVRRLFGKGMIARAWPGRL
jgi:FkbM family methyltransferase